MKVVRKERPPPPSRTDQIGAARYEGELGVLSMCRDRR
jgi:hypothetical protein